AGSWAMDLTAIAIWSIFQGAAIGSSPRSLPQTRRWPGQDNDQRPRTTWTLVASTGFRRAVSTACNCWRVVRKPGIRRRLRRRAALTVTDALVARLRRRANRAF